MPELVRIDTDAQQAWRGGVLLPLARLEFKLLAVLVENAGRVVPQRQVLRQVWDTEWHGVRRTMVTTLMRVRKALGDDWQNPTYITTIIGEGLRFNPAMVEPSQTQTVDIDGRRYSVVRWERHPFHGSTVEFTLHAREVVADGRA